MDFKKPFWVRVAFVYSALCWRIWSGFKWSA